MSGAGNGAFVAALSATAITHDNLQGSGI